jgi:hypothetical protein
MKMIAVAVLIVLCGCQKAPPLNKVGGYTDTREGRTAKYVHDHCSLEARFPPVQRWDTTEGKLEITAGERMYKCPDLKEASGDTQRIIIYDKDEQP